MPANRLGAPANSIVKYSEMPIQVDILISEIEAAFRGVQLGHGTSILEAREIDYRSPKERRLKAREKDVETSWQAVDDCTRQFLEE